MAANNTNDDQTSPEGADAVAEDVAFEAALEELETLVADMESGSMSLDESLQAFERGIALTRHCQNALKQAELKVRTLTRDGELVDFETDELDDA